MSTPTSKKNRNIPPLRLQDPHLEREKLKYEQPLPSREFILQQLAEHGVPMFAAELSALLDIEAHEQANFSRRLAAMERSGEVVINRKGAICAADKLDLVRCKVAAHRDGYGFAMPLEGEGGDFYLGEREMRQLLPGDTVMVRPGAPDRRGRREGRVVEVLERALTEIVARVYFEHGVWTARAEDRRIAQDFLVEPGGEGNAASGQVVVLGIVEYPGLHRLPVGRVSEVLGDYADPGMEIEIALRKHDLPHRFSEAALAQAKATPKKVRKKDMAGRVDLREMPLVTIDGETSRDFDDAVYAERAGKGWRLVVAIADVSHYVEPGDALDVDAYERATSVYFPRRVIPMLPEALSNGICSLNPDVDRLCMVCDMQLGARGKVKAYRFYPAVMRSRARLTYGQVWQWLQDGSEHPLRAEIDALHAVFRLLLARREQRGAIEFDTVETQMLFNESCKIDEIVPVVRNDAHRLIEECMLAANVCAADFIATHRRKVLYRVHEGPTPEKLENLRAFLGGVGLTLEGGDQPTTADYAQLAATIRTRPDAEVLETMLLRSMQQAVYTPDNKGHFGLAYAAYAHFTSPIRRYPDLLVHRAIKATLEGLKYKPARKWAEMGVHCSMAERRADDASRDVEAWLKTYYMRDKVGEVFEGKISAVTGFGVFVLLDGVHVEGLLHISELGRDYFHFRKEQQAIVGERSGARYQLGDRLQVKVVRADLDAARIDFALVAPDATEDVSAEPAAGASAKRRRRRRGPAAGDAATVAEDRGAGEAAAASKEAEAPAAGGEAATAMPASEEAGGAGPVAGAAAKRRRRRKPADDVAPAAIDTSDVAATAKDSEVPVAGGEAATAVPPSEEAGATGPVAGTGAKRRRTAAGAAATKAKDEEVPAASDEAVPSMPASEEAGVAESGAEAKPHPRRRRRKPAAGAEDAGENS